MARCFFVGGNGAASGGPSSSINALVVLEVGCLIWVQVSIAVRQLLVREKQSMPGEKQLGLLKRAALWATLMTAAAANVVLKVRQRV